jgi:sporulation protein YlmC with PRC-barrel domain
MRSRNVLAGLLASTVLCAAATAQQAPAKRDTAPSPQASTTVTTAAGWRASKLIGLNVYNDQNEKIGDINEILVDQSGKVTGFVLGAGGFLGIGEHDVLVKPDQLKFVNEPVRTSATGTGPAPTTGSGATTGTKPADRAADRPARAANEKWYPDHAVMNATKDQLKSMPQFKYN